MINEYDYEPPVSYLLRYGDVRDLAVWHSYSDRGIGPEHVADLIRMALDKRLHAAEGNSLESWAPIHAWRALGQMQAEEAARPLVGLFRLFDDDYDWVAEELPEVIAMLGPSAIPTLEEFLRDPSNRTWPRTLAISSLEFIVDQYPERRDDVVSIVSRQLEEYRRNHPILNGSLLAALLRFKAVETLPVIERAFAANRIDKSIAGDLEDVEVEFGLRTERETPPRNHVLEMALHPMDDEDAEDQDDFEDFEDFLDDIPEDAAEPGIDPTPHRHLSRPLTDDARKAKARRKQAKKSRKKNRKK